MVNFLHLTFGNHSINFFSFSNSLQLGILPQLPKMKCCFKSKYTYLTYELSKFSIQRTLSIFLQIENPFGLRTFITTLWQIYDNYAVKALTKTCLAVFNWVSSNSLRKQHFSKENAASNWNSLNRSGLWKHFSERNKSAPYKTRFMKTKTSLYNNGICCLNVYLKNYPRSIRVPVAHYRL